MDLRKIFALFFSVLMFIGISSAAFKENMDVNDGASAKVDRPLINHVKVFLINHYEPAYNWLFADEESGG